MLPQLNPISVILAVLVAAGGFVGGYAAHDAQDLQVQENSFEGMVKSNVTQVDNEIQALRLAYNNSSVGYFRADCQNTQQYITEKWQAASRDSGISQEERRINGEYKAFLIEATRITDIYLARSNPDFIKYDHLRDKILY